MKKILLTLLGRLMAFSATAQAGKTFTYCCNSDPDGDYPDSDDLIEYRVLNEENKMCEAIGGPKWDGEGSADTGMYITRHVKIPDVVKDEQGVKYTVTRVGDDFIAFYDYVRSLRLPSTVTEIGINAFLGCHELKDVYFREGLQHIDNSAFAQCWSLESISLPSTLTNLGENTFAHCTALEEIELPAGLTTIPYRAFYSCDVLKKVNSDYDRYVNFKNIEVFGEGAFGNCPKLMKMINPIGDRMVRRRILFSPNLREIDASAFAGSDEGFPHLIMAVDTPPAIDETSFPNCGEIDIYVPAASEQLYKGHPVWGNFIVKRISEKGTEFIYEGLRYVVTDRTTAKCEGPEAGTFDGETLVLPEEAYDENEVGYTVIGVDGFRDSKNLRKVELPSSIGSLSQWVFTDCDLLAEINLPEGITIIPENAFGGCTNLKNITFPLTLEEIHFEAFENCTSLTYLIIPPAIHRIDDDAFQGCSGLVKVVDPINTTYHAGFPLKYGVGYDRNDVTIEDGYVYNGDKTRLLSVPLDLQGTYTVPESVTAIGRHAFARCDLLTSLEMTESMKEIGEEAFLDCSSLKSVALGNSVNTIAHRAFMGCTSLPSIQIVPSVTTIGNEAFKNCIALSSIEIGPTVTGLGYGAFKGCTSLTSVKLSDSLTTIPEELCGDCTSLSSFEFPSTTTAIDRYAFLRCSALSTVNLPEGLETIGEYAFQECTSLTAIDIPGFVESIGTGAFTRCNKLQSIELPTFLSSISDEMLDGCSALEWVTIPGTVTTIGKSAFRNCSSLRDLQLPGMLESVGENVISGCNGLNSITLYAETPPTALPASFTAKNYDVPLFVEPEAVDTYKNTPYWRGFSVYAIGEDVSNVPVMAIEGIPTESDDTPTARLSFRLPLVWSSDNEDVATVTKKGVVTATKQGEATITAPVYGHPELTDTHHVIVVQNITSGTLDVRTEKMSVSVRPGAIIVENVADGETVNLFTADGVLQASQKSFGEPVELPTIAGKIYIVSVNGFALKVIGK